MAVVQPAVCLQPADGGCFPPTNAAFYGVTHLQDTSCWQHGFTTPYTLACERPSAELLPGQAPAYSARLPAAREVHAPTLSGCSPEREGSWRATASPQRSEALSWLSGWAKLAAAHDAPPSDGGCATPPQRAQHPSALSNVWGDTGSLTHSGHSSPAPVAPADRTPRKRPALSDVAGDASPWSSAHSAATAPPSAPPRRTRARRSLDLAPAAARDPSGDAISVSSLPAMRLCALPAGPAAPHPTWVPRGDGGAGARAARPAPSPPLPLELSLGQFGADEWEALDAALAALNDAPSPLLPQLAACPDWL